MVPASFIGTQNAVRNAIADAEIIEMDTVEFSGEVSR